MEEKSMKYETTQVYLGKISDTEAIRWMDSWQIDSLMIRKQNIEVSGQ